MNEAQGLEEARNEIARLLVQVDAQRNVIESQRALRRKTVAALSQSLARLEKDIIAASNMSESSLHQWHLFQPSRRLQPCDCICGKPDRDSVHKNWDRIPPSEVLPPNANAQD